MIYILRKSKRFNKTNTIKKSLTDAKFYLYNLSFPNFKYSDFYVAGSDYAWELDDLISFFSKDFLQKVDKPTFDIYYVNGDIIKPERQSDKFFTLNFYQRLKSKIEKEFLDYSVALSIKTNRIAIRLENNLLHMDFILDEQLNILDALINSEIQEDYQYLSLLSETKQKLNSLIYKQRYYYKNKETSNDNK